MTTINYFVFSLLFLLLLGDIWPQFEREEGADEPEWVKTEREHFSKDRDKTMMDHLTKRRSAAGYHLLTTTMPMLKQSI